MATRQPSHLQWAAAEARVADQARAAFAAWLRDNPDANQQQKDAVMRRMVHRFSGVAQRVADAQFASDTGDQVLSDQSLPENPPASVTQRRKRMSDAELLGEVDRTVKNAARRRYARNAAENGKRWGRVPVGETCAWCVMLASRGPVYLGEDRASASHRNCDCVIKAFMPGQEWPVDVGAMGDMWARASQAAGPRATMKEILKELRRLPDAAGKIGDAAKGARDSNGRVKTTSAPITSQQIKDVTNDGISTRHLVPLDRGSWGSVLIPDELRLEAHEIATAQRLSRVGLNVDFKELDHSEGAKNPDAVINGEIWEFKSPRGSGKTNISQQFKNARHQGSHRLVIDSARSPLDEDEVRMEMRRRLAGSEWFSEIMHVSKSGNVTWWSKHVIL
jgi:hypothetical protein